MKEIIEFIFENEKVGLSRQNSEQVWVETIYKRIMNNNLNKKISNSLFKEEYEEQNVLQEGQFNDKYSILLNERKVPNFSIIQHTSISPIDLQGNVLNENKRISTEKLNFNKLKEEEKVNKISEEINLTKSPEMSKISFINSFNSKNPKHKYLQNLLLMLKLFFKNKSNENEIKSLDLCERKILNSILMRKYKQSLQESSDIHKLIEQIELIKLNNLTKRPEQNYKLIFMLTLKYMKDKLKQNTDKSFRKKDSEKYFYNFYFKEVSEEEKIPIEHFYHPKSSKIQRQIKSKNTPKTINLYYIQNISKSKNFIRDFFEYLKNNLIADYEKLIDYKLETLFNRWSLSIFESENKNEAVNDICKYMEQNNKCKLPWDINEIKIAIKCTEKLFY
jgi:hypothetical protein